jgi:hypothetical protein
LHSRWTNCTGSRRNAGSSRLLGGESENPASETRQKRGSLVPCSKADGDLTIAGVTCSALSFEIALDEARNHAAALPSRRHDSFPNPHLADEDIRVARATPNGNAYAIWYGRQDIVESASDELSIDEEFDEMGRVEL